MSTSPFNGRFSAAGSQEFVVTDYSYEVGQATDSKGRPSSDMQGGILQVSFIADDMSKKLLAWFADPYLKMGGKIVFDRPDQASAMITISFEDAYCIKLKDVFRAGGDGTRPSMVRTLLISVPRITYNGAIIDHQWDSVKS